MKLHAHYLYLVEQITELESELNQSIKTDDATQRIMTIPGVGPITASLLSSQLGDGKQFSCSRDFAASTGLLLLPQGLSPGNTVQEVNRLCWVSANGATKTSAVYWFSVPARS